MYDFKVDQELLWFLLVAVLTALASALVEFDPSAVTDWRAWAVGLAAACVRAAAGALLAWLGARRARPEPGDGESEGQA